MTHTNGEWAVSGVEIRIVELGPMRRRLELRGALPIGWAGRLASALAAQGVSVLSGRARHQGASRWDAQLEVDLPDASLPLRPPALAAALSPDHQALRPAGAVELRTHRVYETGEDVVVELEAIDCHGFLDRVLRLFAFHGLFPREMTIDTVDGRIHDAFRLRAIHGGAPEQATIRALDARLRAMRIGLRPARGEAGSAR